MSLKQQEKALQALPPGAWAVCALVPGQAAGDAFQAHPGAQLALNDGAFLAMFANRKRLPGPITPLSNRVICSRSFQRAVLQAGHSLPVDPVFGSLLSARAFTLAFNQ